MPRLHRAFWSLPRTAVPQSQNAATVAGGAAPSPDSTTPRHECSLRLCPTQRQAREGTVYAHGVESGRTAAEDRKREMSGPVVQRDGSPETGVRRSLPVHGPPKAPIVPLGAGGHWLCRFFMQGGPSACRNGDKCPYSHDPNKPVSAHVYARVRGPRDDFAQSRSRTGSGFCAIASPCHLQSAPP